MFFETLPSGLPDDPDKQKKDEREERHRVLFEREIAKEFSRGDDHQDKTEQLAARLKEIAKRDAEEAKKRETPDESPKAAE